MSFMIFGLNLDLATIHTVTELRLFSALLNSVRETQNAEQHRIE
jgi:hypothetical protein